MEEAKKLCEKIDRLLSPSPNEKSTILAELMHMKAAIDNRREELVKAFAIPHALCVPPNMEISLSALRDGNPTAFPQMIVSPIFAGPMLRRENDGRWLSMEKKKIKIRKPGMKRKPWSLRCCLNRNMILSIQESAYKRHNDLLEMALVGK